MQKILIFVLFHVVYWWLAIASVDLCLPTWNYKAETHSIDGESQGNMPLPDCLALCERVKDCFAIDFDISDNSCWMHKDPNYILPDQIYSDSNKFQYSINRTCVNLLASIEYCPSTWTSYKSTSSLLVSYGVDYATLGSCFNYCRFTTSCYGFEYDTTAWPICKIYEDISFASDENRVGKISSTLYSFDKNGCQQNQSQKVYARCSGQSFPPVSDWCPPGQNVTITKKLMKDHPFCCKEVYMPDLTPLDNNELMAIVPMNSNYSSVIDECLANFSCALKALEISWPFSKSSYCSVDKNYLNSLVIYFSCTGLQTASTIPNIIPSMETVSSHLQNDSSSSLSTHHSFIVSQSVTNYSQIFFPSTPPVPSSTAQSPLSLPPPTTAVQPSTTNSILSISESSFLPTSSAQPTISFLPPPSTVQPSTANVTLSPPPYTLSSIKVATSISKDPGITTSSRLSFITSTSTTTEPSLDSTNFNKQQRDKTALVLGALGTTFGLISLLILLLLLVLFCDMFRNRKVQDVNEMIDKVSWKTIIHGSSVA